MKLSISLVSVKRISSTVSRSTFTEEELEHSGRLILEAEGIINPIILRRTSLDAYEVVEGDFEYYAAAKAREIAPRKGEMIGAFIIEEDKERAIIEQIKVLRKSQSTIIPKDLEIEPGDFESRLTSLESYLNKQIQEIKNERKEERKWLETRLKEFEDKICSKEEALGDEDETSKRKKPWAIFNEAQQKELITRLINAGLPKLKAEKVAESVEKERKLKGFVSLSDVVERVKIKQGKKKIQEIKGISNETMVKIIDHWSSMG